MDPKSKKKVESILAAGPDAASEADLAFLAARRSYLTNDQKVTFGITEPVSTESSDAAPAKRSRKAAAEEAAA